MVIGGGGEQLLLRVAARHAAIWNYGQCSPEVYRHKSEVLDKHCATIGRDPATIERSAQLYVGAADLAATRRLASEFIAAGATHVILQLYAPYPGGIVQRLAEEVAEPLHAEYEEDDLPLW